MQLCHALTFFCQSAQLLAYGCVHSNLCVMRRSLSAGVHKTQVAVKCVYLPLTAPAHSRYMHKRSINHTLHPHCARSRHPRAPLLGPVFYCHKKLPSCAKWIAAHSLILKEDAPFGPFETLLTSAFYFWLVHFSFDVKCWRCGGSY